MESSEGNKAVKEGRVSVLFVDDEPNLLAALRRAMRAVRGECEVYFASSGYEALTAIERGSLDIVVSDMRMPGIDGAQLLEEVRRRCPDTVRIILSGQASRESIIRGVASTHRYLSKPHDPVLLRQVLGSASALRSLVPSVLVRRRISQVGAFPCQSNVLEAMRRELGGVAPDKGVIAELLAQDMGILAKVFHITLATTQSSLEDITSVRDIIDVLNVEMLTEAVRSDDLFSSATDARESEKLKRFSEHSLAVAHEAHLAASRLEDQAPRGAFVAGLFHDIGKLVLVQAFREVYQDSIWNSCNTLSEQHVEEKYLGIDHTHVGGYFLGLWGLGFDTVNAIVGHHAPEAIRGGMSPLTAILWYANRKVHDEGELQRTASPVVIANERRSKEYH